VKPLRPDDRLSPHFVRSELWCPCGCGGVPRRPTIYALEMVRSQCGNRPIYPTSGFRCPTHNATIRYCKHCQLNSRVYSCEICGRETVQRSAKNSQHTHGNAVDFKVDGMTPQQVARVVERHVPAFATGGIGIYRTFIHCDIGPGPRRWSG
jgi:predicted RNA-binding Zn-ribbon protein involved in translation (DUF1610 family)